MTSQEQLDIASLLDSCRGKLMVVEAENENLKLALVSARRIGAAMGILMERLKVTDDAAFAPLSRHSQTSNTKLRDVADQVVLTGGF